MPYLEDFFFFFFTTLNIVSQITFIINFILGCFWFLPTCSFMLLYFERFICLFIHLFIHFILTTFLVNVFLDFYCLFIDFNVLCCYASFAKRWSMSVNILL